MIKQITMNGNEEILAKINSLILDELKKAEIKHPGWPDDVVHGAAILGEEAGEVIKASIDYYYGGGDKNELIEEAAQTGAMAVRLLIYLLGEYNE